MGTVVSLGANKLPFRSSGVGTTLSQAGPCWEMAPCRAGLAPSPGCQPPSCPRREQSLPWALPQTPSILGGLARGGTRGLVALGGSLSSRKGLGVPTAPALPWVGAAGQADSVLCPLLARALPPTGVASPQQQGEGLGMRSGGLGAPAGTGSLPPAPLPPARLAHLPPSPRSIFPLGNLAPSLKSLRSRRLPIPVYPDYPSQRWFNPG